LVNTTSHGWRPLFWFGACPPVLIIVFRLLLPETIPHIEQTQAMKTNKKKATSTFISQGVIALEQHWLLLAYMVLLMAGFNFLVGAAASDDSGEYSDHSRSRTVPRTSTRRCLRTRTTSAPPKSQ
jgi:SHS family lactate transporter-like MFS transporter